MTLATPVTARQRLDVLDILRGFALFGILLANSLIFSGVFFANMVGAVESTPLDTVFFYVQEVFIHGKFYSIFSILFGIGFYLFYSRAAERMPRPGRLFARRLAILLGIGIVHATLIWAGDILILYALLGFLLLAFFHARPRTLLLWVAVFLGLKVGVYCLMWASGMGDPMGPPPPGTPRDPDAFNPIQVMLNGFPGGYFDVLQANAVQLVGRWMNLILSLRPFPVLAMFVLGLWIGKQGIAADLARHRGLLETMAWLGLVGGVILNGLWAWLASDATPYLPGSALGAVEVLVETIGVPLLALGYMAAFALLVSGAGQGRLVNWLAPVGRMALTNYLMQSILAGLIFYGYGLGYYGQVGFAGATLMVVPIFLLQIPLSHWWLGRYRYGPMEWVWRKLTYGGEVPMKR
ncbi:DUF418 domain-containing protein [Wenzhouxiangella marina]|uniref:DUF418 domain-containing protein n=1 Tax=Wenzhouxiangella marina TaxID=1579979 RepID=A0A0K0XU75_9GAMM|nr:DUF418 domain-containing protein [Wenzhouxiangella marina]AKS41254.1 hypothetical protein WM2015_873 [Wenzhouxiangella marina]MBB6088134.1 uncharacterized protein [Wenzhouxiangella marina]